MVSLHEQALTLLRTMVGAHAAFREHQYEAIEDLVEHRRRVLLVERTGFGKSAVYFIATKVLREGGAGPTILVSPLLALMRNQVARGARGRGRWRGCAGIPRESRFGADLAPERATRR